MCTTDEQLTTDVNTPGATVTAGTTGLWDAAEGCSVEERTAGDAAAAGGEGVGGTAGEGGRGRGADGGLGAAVDVEVMMVGLTLALLRRLLVLLPLAPPPRLITVAAPAPVPSFCPPLARDCPPLGPRPLTRAPPALAGAGAGAAVGAMRKVGWEEEEMTQ